MSDLRVLAENATPGPWFHPEVDDDGDYDDERLIVQEQGYSNYDYLPIPNNETDAEYLAACSPDVILGLLGELDGLRTAAQAVVDQFDPTDWSPINFQDLSDHDDALSALAGVLGRGNQ